MSDKLVIYKLNKYQSSTAMQIKLKLKSIQLINFRIKSE